jgi:hypothetical protein
MAKQTVKTEKTEETLLPLTGQGAKELNAALAARNAAMGELKTQRSANQKELNAKVKAVMVAMGYYMAENAKTFGPDEALVYYHGSKKAVEGMHPNVRKARRNDFQNVFLAAKGKVDLAALYDKAGNRNKFIDFCRYAKDHPKASVDEIAAANIAKVEKELTVNAGDCYARIKASIGDLIRLGGDEAEWSRPWIAMFAETYKDKRDLGQLQTSAELKKNKGQTMADPLAAFVAETVPATKTVN